jgi:hypothetical protein
MKEMEVVGFIQPSGIEINGVEKSKQHTLLTGI